MLEDRRRVEAAPVALERQTPPPVFSGSARYPRPRIPSRRHGKPGTTGKGNPWTADALGEAAIGAARTKTFLGSRYHRLARKRGKPRRGRNRTIHPRRRLPPALRPRRPVLRPRPRLARPDRPPTPQTTAHRRTGTHPRQEGHFRGGRRLTLSNFTPAPLTLRRGAAACPADHLFSIRPSLLRDGRVASRENPGLCRSRRAGVMAKRLLRVKHKIRRSATPTSPIAGLAQAAAAPALREARLPRTWHSRRAGPFLIPVQSMTPPDISI